MRVFIALTLALTITFVVANTSDETVPAESFAAEEVLEKDEDLVAAHTEAKNTISLLQKTLLDKDCEGCGERLIKEVVVIIKDNQKILDKLDKGHRCASEGLKLVHDAKRRKKMAEQHLRKRTHELNRAKSSPVDFRPQVFGTIREGHCGAFYNDGAYKAVRARYHRCVKHHNSAKGAAKNAKKMLKHAYSAHRRAVLHCKCRIQQQHAKEWRQANSGNARNAKSWRRAHHVMCVLKDTPLNRCRVGPLPRLRKPRLASGVSSARCNGVKLGRVSSGKERSNKERANKHRHRHNKAKKERANKKRNKERANKHRRNKERANKNKERANKKRNRERANKNKERAHKNNHAVKAGRHVALRGGRTNRWCADETNRVICNRGHIAQWERFYIGNGGGGKVALRGGRTNRWCADETNRVRCNRGHVRQWEKFTVSNQGSGRVALKGGKSHRWCADDSEVKCNRGHIKQWERFTVSHRTNRHISAEKSTKAKKERANKNKERSNKNKERANKNKERANKERSNKERSNKERANKNKERANKNRERANKNRRVNVQVRATTGRITHSPTGATERVTIQGSRGRATLGFRPAGSGRSKTASTSVKNIGNPSRVTLVAGSTDGWYFTSLQVRVGNGRWFNCRSANRWLDGKPYDRHSTYSGRAYSNHIVLSCR